MECNKWEESGLLYTSNELDDEQREQFENHCRECSTCAGELKTYQQEKAEFFTLPVLSESPSQKTDQEILRVCSTPPQTKTSLNIFA
ncbi:MAG: hypothetical protein GF350_12450, partial [Chitinivibrionales bacterium]|nr:hypothetical protein [Chitinivibrionales bacterium]